MLLSKEQTDLMTWLENQPEPICMAAMQAAEAPGYSMDRVNKMHKDGLLDSTYVFYGGEGVPGYRVSDQGRAMLDEIKARDKSLADQRRKERRDTRRYWITTGIAIAALIKAFLPELSAVTAWLLKLLGL